MDEDEPDFDALGWAAKTLRWEARLRELEAAAADPAPEPRSPKAEGALTLREKALMVRQSPAGHSSC